jgi:hypothetical protein
MNIHQLSFLMRWLGYGGLECEGSQPKVKLLYHVLPPWKRHRVFGVLETAFSIVFWCSL